MKGEIMEKRKPTYGSAIRMSELILMLSKAWRPMPVNYICEYFNISLRTAQRYRKALNENLIAEDGGKILRVVKEGRVEKWYLADQDEIMTATFSRIVSAYVAMVLLKSLESTVIEEGVKQLWEMIAGQLKPSVKIQLEQFERKIRHSGFGRKSYSGQNKELAEILKGLVNQTKLQVLHYSHNVQKEKYHIIHPYTLLLHRDSLYLHAYVEGYDQVRTFLIDRIKEVVNKNEHFRYPSNFDPNQLTDGSFGIFQTPKDRPSKITIQFKEILWEYITTRRWHSTQKFSRIKNGIFTMEIGLKNTNEFIPWVLQFGSDAKVVEPKSLKNKIKKELLSAYENY
jgi:predicted DNA-binding transcriptional regulator YafY